MILSFTEPATPLLSSARLARWTYQSATESPSLLLPGHLDGGFHIVSQDNKLRRPAVVMGAKARDVDLSHSGRENSEKKTEGQEGAFFLRPAKVR